MEILSDLLSFFLHIDQHLRELASQYGGWLYGILFLIVFCETGLVVTPFLPGDSLLFAAGSLTAMADSAMNIHTLFLLLTTAAILGDTVNYSIGHYLGERAYNIKWIKKEYLDKTHAFFEKHGGITIFLARFVPIVRTFAPFVAGIGRMTYGYFISYNFIGGIVWVTLFTFAGYFFGNIPFIRKNFEFVIVAIILISVLPMVFEWLKARREKKKAPAD